MESLGRRIKRLEGMFSRCPSCRTTGGEQEEITVEWLDGWVEDENGELVPSPPEDVEEEYCGTCGEPLVIVIGWGDQDEEEEDR